MSKNVFATPKKSVNEVHDQDEVWIEIPRSRLPGLSDEQAKDLFSQPRPKTFVRPKGLKTAI